MRNLTSPALIASAILFIGCDANEPSITSHDPLTDPTTEEVDPRFAEWDPVGSWYAVASERPAARELAGTVTATPTDTQEDWVIDYFDEPPYGFTIDPDGVWTYFELDDGVVPTSVMGEWTQDIDGTVWLDQRFDATFACLRTYDSPDEMTCERYVSSSDGDEVTEVLYLDRGQ